MGIAKLNSFGGLVTSAGNPAFGTAKACSNFVRHRRRGWLEQPDPYGKKFTDGLPQADAKMSNLVFKDLINFHVPDHGGADITVVVGTYRKTSQYDEAVYIDRSGIWMRPYWSGSAWVDAWLEMTECEILKLSSLSATSTLNFADAGFATDKFKNWIVVFEDYSQAQDHDNYLLVESSTSSSVTYFGDNTNLSRAADAKMILARSFLQTEMPSVLQSQIYRLLSEIRFTSGNDTNGISLLGGFRTKEWSWSTSDKNVDRLIVDVGCLNLWRYCIGLINPIAVADATDPLPAGYYGFKNAIVTDDNQISDIRDPFLTTNADIAQVASVDKSLLGQISPYYHNDIVSDGSFFYAAKEGNPAKIVKFNKSDLSVESELELESGRYFTFASLTIIGTDLYVAGNFYPALKYIYKIDLNTFTLTTKVDFALNGIGCLTTDGTYLYESVTNEPSAGNLRLHKIQTSDLSIVSSYNDAVNLFLGPVEIKYHSGYILGIGDCQVLSVDNAILFKIDIATMSLAVDYVELGDGTYGYLRNHLTILDENLFISQESYSVYGRILKIDITAMTVMSSLELNEYFSGITNDGEYLFAALHGNKIINRLDPITLAYRSLDSPASVTPGPLIFAESYIYSLVEQFSYIQSALIHCDGTNHIEFNAIVSAGALPVRARYLRIYITSNNVNFYRIKDIDLYDTDINWGTAAYYVAESAHFYHRSSVISIKGSDLLVIGAEMTVDAGRAVTDTGIIKYKTATVVGYKTYAGNLLKGVTQYLNTIFHNASSGDAVQQLDVFPTDGAHMINVEYGDGDEINALAPMGEKLLTLKKRSIVLIEEDGQGGYRRNMVTQSVGCCSSDSVAWFNEVVYWADYNGLHGISTYEGLQLLNSEWVEDWKTLTQAQKEAAQSVIDRANKLWIISAGGQQWVYDLQDKQWLGHILTDTPLRLVQDIPGTIDILTASKLLTINKSGADRFDGANYTMQWESNKWEILKEGKGYIFDILVRGLIVEYESSIDLTLGLYLDDATTPAETYTLLSSNKKMILQAPFGARCKAPRVKISGTTTASGQTVKVKCIELQYDEIETGGDTVSY